MGLSYVTMAWFERLHSRGAFTGKQSILELGPQDFVAVRADDICRFHKNIRGADLVPVDVQRQFFDTDGRARWWTATRDLYAILGLTDYHGVDTEDPRADFIADLNNPTELPRKFDVVTDYGTLEHIFNIANAAKFVYDHLEIGGVALHVLPTRGDYNHGFYNLHATFFSDLASANGYDLLDLLFVPDFGRQNEYRNREVAPGQPLWMETPGLDPDFRERAFAEEVLAHIPGTRGVADFLFAAIRKTHARPFVFPIQDNYANLIALRDRVDTPHEQLRHRFRAHARLALAYFAQDRWQDGIAHLRTALPFMSDDVELLYEIAMKLWNAGQYLPEAIVIADHIRTLTPQDAKALRFLNMLRSGVTPAELRRQLAG